MVQTQDPPGGLREISFDISDQYSNLQKVGEGAYGVMR